MPLPSKADRLPPPLREALANLWFEQKYSLDQILAHLNALARGERSMLPPELAAAPAIPPEAVPGRSGLHAHLKGVSKAAEKVRRSRMAAEVLAREFGDASDDKVAQANFTMLHTAVNDIFMAAAEAEGDEDGPPVTIDPKSAMMLAITLEKTEGAKKKHADLRAQIRKEAAAAAVAAADKALGEVPDRAAVLKRIREEVYGIVGE
ncbi:DUF3486 family protein [Paramagnetospirillum magneticum]|uniref:Mu-like prophage FluMu protein gp27 n=1 Tax=Paramagnetospirillum magneticum (strain ATCC 700264 / AMB-1) TaxID=342108 RepID=Q2WA48_PARM1|nr:DUF3486 family protein [Paramagnetospirillum magneticum]BAE49277.1 Mu-like prophage FluMu protein gp27 [Paramagnetospirillum magneticum AMB-1]